MDPLKGIRHRGGALVAIALAAAILSPTGAVCSRAEPTPLLSPPAPMARTDALAAPAPSALPTMTSLGGGPRVVHVAWYDVERLSASNVELVSAQVSACFQEAGVTLLWRRGEIGVSTEEVAADEVPVLLLPGDDSPRGGARPVLGTTTTNRDGPRLVHVFLQPIRTTLGLRSLGEALSPMEARQLAQSVARVIVHELLHALAPQQAHSTRGLMKHSLSRAELLSPLDTGDAAVVRARLSSDQAAAAASRPQGGAASRTGKGRPAPASGA
jgi:hypothetical protein